MRTFVKEGSGSDFRNPENSTEDNPTRSPIIAKDDQWPLIRVLTIFGESHTREMVLLFSDDSTDGYDQGMDALHPMDATSEAYFPIITDNGIEPFVIQTVPFENYKQIPINFILNEQMIVSVKAVEFVNFNRSTYLWDSLNDTYKEIKEGNLQSEAYQFILPAGEYNDRFFIVFKNGRQMIEDSEGTKAIEIAKASVNFFQNNPYQQMEISNPDGYNIKSAAVYDMTGKLVATKHNVGTVSNFNIPTANLADGVYLIKLITIENINIDYKMIIQNK